MPIEVHCPNPVCARSHLVKDRYAGIRGRCPACRSWMYVPTRRMETPGGPATTPSPPTVKQDPARPGGEAKAKPKPARRFSWLAAALLVLGILSLGGIAAMPFLEGATVEASGDFAEQYASVEAEGVKDEARPFVLGIPVGVAGLAFLSLLIGVEARRFGSTSLFLVYLSALMSAGLLFLALFSFQDQWQACETIRHQVEADKEHGMAGDVTASVGPYLYAGLGGAVGASLCFLLAAVVMHKRWWARSISFLIHAGAPAVAAVWVFRAELGIPYLGNYFSF
jgi:hypothetical protein